MIALSVSEYCVLEWSPARRGPGVRRGRQGDARMSAAKFTKREGKKPVRGKKERERREKRQRERERERERNEEKRRDERKREKRSTTYIGPVITGLYRCFVQDFIAVPSPLSRLHRATWHRMVSSIQILIPTIDTAINTILIKRSISIELIDRPQSVDHSSIRSSQRFFNAAEFN